MITITLDDGTRLENLGLNGNNYISRTKVDESIFENNLSTMTVSDGKNETVYHNAELVQQMEWDDGTWYLSFREKTGQELAMEAMKKVVEDNANDMSNLQLALTEVYEMMLGGV